MQGAKDYMNIRGSVALKLCLCLVAFAAVAAGTTPPTLIATPAAVSFQYSSGEPQPQPVNVLVTASDGSTPVLTSVTIAPLTAPAALFPQSGLIVTGDTISVGYDVNTLQTLVGTPGTYTAVITVTATGFATSLNIPVSFVIGTAVSIAGSPSSLTFSAPSQLAPQTVAISSSDGAEISFVVTSDSTWLSATAVPTYTPSALTVMVNAANLPAATYQGNITLTPSTGGSVTIPVTLQVGTNTLGINPAALAFAYTVGGTTPPVQTVQLSSLLASDTYTAQAKSTGNWLLVNGVTTEISGAVPATLNVTVNPTGLAAGTYLGTISATDTGGTQTVTVTLVVSNLSSVANPAALTFVAQASQAAPASQLVWVSGSPDTPYTATATSTGGWLSVSPATGPSAAEVTVAVNPGTLAAGTYTGTVQVSAAERVQNIQVTLIVSATPVLMTTPGSFIENYFGGGPPLGPQSLTVTASSGVSQAFTISGGLPSWLQVSTGGGPTTTPAILNVTATAQTLPTGSYLAQVVLIPAATTAVPVGTPVVVPIFLTVENATAVVASPASLSLSAIAGAAPLSQTVELTASSPATFTSSATSVGNWLSVSPASGSADAVGTPLTVTADATSLAKGTYQGTVTLTTAGGVVTTIAVAFTVSGPSSPIAISPSTLAFAYTLGGTVPAAQTLQIAGTQSFTAAATTSTGGTWLAVTPASGTGNASLSVTVNPAGLALGAYNGTITVTPTGGVAQTVAVTLTVYAMGSLTIAPGSLSFAFAAGGPPAAPQTVVVTSTGQPVTFTATAFSTGWLAVTQSAATTPANVIVTVNPTSLSAGIYAGSIELIGSSGAVQLTIDVSLAVTSSLPVIGAVVNGASYLEGGIAPGEIVTIFGTSLGPATGVLAAINAGYIGTTLANVTVTFNGYPAPILYAYSGQLNVIVPYEVAGAANASIETTFGAARSNVVILTVVSAAPGVFSDDATGKGEGAILDTNYNLVSASNPVSGGSVIQIFATGQGQTSPGGVDGLIEPAVLPLPAPLLSAGVTIGGVAATSIQYVGAAPGLVAGALQIDVTVPDGLPSGPAALVVSFGGVDFSQPGLTVAIQ
jgi:uncharacterized protein (TIGR03437 family)